MEIMKMNGYGFRYAGEEALAIEDISFGVNSGELILIAGDSGSGKSTFLKSINGLIPAIVEGELRGERYAYGRSFDDLPIYELSGMIGSVFQNPRSQFFTLDSTSELVFAMENYGYCKEDMEKRIEELSAEIPVKPLLGRDILTLSSGERQILAIACAMALSPNILLFDEPSANLDYGNVMRLREIFRKLKSLGKTVMVADHRFFYLDGMVDRVFLIRNSKMEIFGSEDEFKKSDYNTRSFDLFGMDIALRPSSRSDIKLAELKNVKKSGIFEDVSISFFRNEITAIIGQNGVGKTTLAKLLTGSIKPDGGEIAVDEMPFYIMQDADYQLFGTSVLNEVELGNDAVDESLESAVLQKLDIWRYRDTHPFDLSGGEKQRLQIAMALLSGAKILIFDEPTSGLDVKSMDRAVKEIAKAAEGRAVIIISHDYEFIRKISNRIVYISEGKVEEDFCLCEETVEKLNQIFIKMEVKNE